VDVDWSNVMKVKGVVKQLCEYCYVVKRKAKLYVYCKKNPKVKARVALIQMSQHTDGMSSNAAQAATNVPRRACCEQHGTARGTEMPQFSNVIYTSELEVTLLATQLMD
jgi:ribosomal protein L36